MRSMRPFSGVIAAAICLGILLRLACLSTDSFWLDEAASVRFAITLPPSQLWTADPTHPPLYYRTLQLVLGVIGVSEAKARLLSAIASLSSLGLMFVLGRRLHLSSEASALASSMLALSTIDLWYAREARMYELAAMVALVMALVLTSRHWWGLLAIAVVLTVALYLEFTLIPVIAGLVGFWLGRWVRVSRRASELAAVILAIVVAAAASRPLWGQLMSVASALDHITFFAKFRALTALPDVSRPMLAILLCAEAGTAAVVAAIGPVLLSRLSGRAVVVWGAAGLFALANVMLAVPRAFSAKQILVTFWPLVTMAAAWGISGGELVPPAPARSRRAAAVVLAVSAVASVSSVFTHRADWRGVVAYLDVHAERDALVLVDPPENSIPYQYYRPVVSARSVPPGDPLAAAAGEADIWLIAERYGARAPTSATEAWLDAHARLVGVVRFARLELRRYAPVGGG